MTKRAIGVFHCGANIGSAWNCAEGLVYTLRAMGHEVLECGHPEWHTVSLDDLRRQDLLIMSGAEWYLPQLWDRYGQGWTDMKVPKAAWYTETIDRDDLTFDFERYRHMADRQYFPAIQDAEARGGVWLPFGVDTTIFNPKPVNKEHEVAFLGVMYPKRAEYVRRTGYRFPLLNSPFVGDKRKATEALAVAYSGIQILLNLPSYSRLIVTKVTEAMACGTLVVTPIIDHPSALRNMEQFEDRKHLIYYPPDQPELIAPILRYYLAHPEEAQSIADAGWTEVTENHTLKIRLQKIIDDQFGPGA